MQKYCGNKEPYIYGLFNENDRQKAIYTLEKVAEKGYKVTYEEKRSNDAIARSSLVLLFVSKSILEDEQLREQINQALKENKNIITLYLEETVLTPGLSMMLNRTQGIRRYTLADDEQFIEKLLSSPALQSLTLSEQQKAASKKAMRTTAIAGGATVALLLILLITGFFSTILPTSPLWKTGLRGNMDEITKVTLYGEKLWQDDYVIAQFDVDEESQEYTIDVGESIPFGDMKDVSAFASLKNIEELCLVGNQIANIQPLLKLEKLQVLDLSGNNGLDISGISALQTLKTLNLAETGITDYSELLELENLETLYVSHDVFEQANKQINGKFKVIEILTPVTTYEELTAALESEHTMYIYIEKSITIPEDAILTIAEDKALGGAGTWPTDEELDVFNYGTVHLYGSWEMGLCTRYNYGTIIVEEGGLYSGGMCDSINGGTFIVEEGGKLELERAHEFYFRGGTLENKGDIVCQSSFEFDFSDGYFINSGNIYCYKIHRGIDFDHGNYTNTGKCYAYTVEVFDDIYLEDDEDVEWEEVAITELKNYTIKDWDSYYANEE